MPSNAVIVTSVASVGRKRGFRSIILKKPESASKVRNSDTCCPLNWPSLGLEACKPVHSEPAHLVVVPDVRITPSP